MALTVNELTETDELAYWNQLEVYARKGRERLVYRTRLRGQLEAGDVNAAALEEVLDKEDARLEAARGPVPTPETVASGVDRT